MTGMYGALLALFALSGLLYSQAIDVTPKIVKLSQVEGGPLAFAKISIRSTGQTVQNWTAVATPGDPNDTWIQLDTTAGVTPGQLTVGIVNWRGESKKAGKFQASISIKSAGPAVTIPVELEIRAPNPPPVISYPAGPTGCNKSAGYLDPPLCTPLPLAGIVGSPQAGASYVDPNFGAHVRVMTAAPIYHTYSTPSPLSAHNKYLMSYLDNG